MTMKVLELFSGIGGMHLALQESGLPYEVVASIEINPTTIKIYKFNFPGTNLINANIQGLTVDFLEKFQPDTVLMSPPCQPFTRNGLQNDIKDPRTEAFLHILNVLPQLSIKRILMENVKGFDTSEMRNIFLNYLKKNGFKYQEFLLSPTQIGVPNSRQRYYCLAQQEEFNFDTISEIITSLPDKGQKWNHFDISSILEENITLEKYYLNDKILRKRCKVLDICYRNSNRSCCFTKSYGRYLEGTGSVFTDQHQEFVAEIYRKLDLLDKESADYLELIKKLNLRFFTPREVCRLMSFPDSFQFPTDVSDKQKYMALGNSINIKLVSELIKLFS